VIGYDELRELINKVIDDYVAEVGDLAEVDTEDLADNIALSITRANTTP